MDGNRQTKASRDHGTGSSITPPERVSIGTDALDEILDGGLLARRLYLVRGGPGLGKIMLGLNFLTAAGNGESSLFIGFREQEDELRAHAENIGIDASSVHFLSLVATDNFPLRGEAYDVSATLRVEQAAMIDAVVAAAHQTRPTRVFIDSLIPLRSVCADPVHFREQVLSLLRFLSDRGATVVFASESTSQAADDDLQSIADGIMDLRRTPSGGHLEITRCRGSVFLCGRHPFRIDEAGFQVFDQILPPPPQIVDTASARLSTGNAKLDNMLGGGVETGTVTLVTGPPGIGQSTFGTVFTMETARAGKAAAICQFEKELSGWVARLRTVGVDPEPTSRKSRLSLEQVDPSGYVMAGFNNTICGQVRDLGLDLVVIDSVSGFELALGANEEFRELLCALIKTLSRMRVTVLLLNENHVENDNLKVSESELGSIADNAIYLLYAQTSDTLSPVIEITRKRLSNFNPTRRHFEVVPGSVRIGGFAAEPDFSAGCGQPPL